MNLLGLEKVSFDGIVDIRDKMNKLQKSNLGNKIDDK